MLHGTYEQNHAITNKEVRGRTGPKIHKLPKIADRWVLPSVLGPRMKCGWPDEEVLWSCETDRQGRTWYFSDVDRNIWVDDPSTYGKSFQGCGGNTFKFEMADGSTRHVRGPWCSNADDLFLATGVERRHLVLTRVVLFRKHGKSQAPRYDLVAKGVIADIVIEGRFEDGEELAQELANRTGHTIFIKRYSDGGAYSGSCNPTESAPRQKPHGVG